MKNYYFYIMATQNNKVIYIGITNNLQRRVIEHKKKLIPGFTQKYNLTKLVYIEEFSDINQAIESEKKTKGWTRVKKNNLIMKQNPEWKDLFEL